MSLFERLLQDAPFSRDELAAIIATASRRYKTYEIEKRNGKGSRTIAQPSAEVKLLQRLLVDQVISTWPVHDAAMGYRRRRSITMHAERHVNSRFLLKLDLVDFFPSITASDIRAHATRQQRPQLTSDDIELLTKLLVWRKKTTREYCLSIGAPSSPACSNALMYEFDSLASAMSKSRGVTYSRYADDLAFSTDTPGVLQDIEKTVRGLLELLPYPRLRINKTKTINVSRRHRRTLVGLVLTPTGAISLGRDRKRSIRAAVHAFARGTLSSEEVRSLQGMLAFVMSSEPTYLDRLARTYGPEVMTLLRTPLAA